MSELFWISLYVRCEFQGLLFPYGYPIISTPLFVFLNLYTQICDAPFSYNNFPDAVGLFLDFLSVPLAYLFIPVPIPNS